MAASAWRSGDCRFLFKIVLLGDSGVGKTALIQRFQQDTFSLSVPLTVGADFSHRRVDVGGYSVRLRLWDTAGQEAFRAIVRGHYRDADAALLVYDITSRATFESLPGWLAEAAERCPPDVKVFVVGCKSDLAAQREVTTIEALRFTRRQGLHVPYETSAKEGVQVSEAFAAIVSSLALDAEEAERCSGGRWAPTSAGDVIDLRKPPHGYARRSRQQRRRGSSATSCCVPS